MLFTTFRFAARWNPKIPDKDPALELAVVKTIAGFMNANGGTLLIGVSDSGSAVGLADDLKLVPKRDRDGYVLWLTRLLMDCIGKAATLYGEGLSDTAYISKLAASLNTSESGVHKWWYERRKVPGPARVTLDLLLKEEPTPEKPIPDRMRRYKDGSVMPNHIFRGT